MVIRRKLDIDAKMGRGEKRDIQHLRPTKGKHGHLKDSADAYAVELQRQLSAGMKRKRTRGVILR